MIPSDPSCSSRINSFVVKLTNVSTEDYYTLAPTSTKDCYKTTIRSIPHKVYVFQGILKLKFTSMDLHPTIIWTKTNTPSGTNRFKLNENATKCSTATLIDI